VLKLTPALLLLMPQTGEQGKLRQVLDKSVSGQLCGVLPCPLLGPVAAFQQSWRLLLLLLLLLLAAAESGTLGTLESDSVSKTAAGLSTAAETHALIASVVMRFAAKASCICIWISSCCRRARVSATKAGTTLLPDPRALNAAAFDGPSALAGLGGGLVGTSVGPCWSLLSLFPLFPSLADELDQPALPVLPLLLPLGPPPPWGGLTQLLLLLLLLLSLLPLVSLLLLLP
jgi:hypothetical protein